MVDGDVNVSGGSNASGNTVINPDSNVINYTMGNPNGQFITGTPIDFPAAAQYLKCASAFWSTLMPNGTGQVIFGQLNLTGTDEVLNIFSLNSSNLYGTGLSLAQLNGINIVAPIDSTILINVDGAMIQFGSYQIFRNGTAATRENARRILWNFPQALTWSNSTTAIYGSVLPPFAAAKPSQIFMPPSPCSRQPCPTSSMPRERKFRRSSPLNSSPQKPSCRPTVLWNPWSTASPSWSSSLLVKSHSFKTATVMEPPNKQMYGAADSSAAPYITLERGEDLL